jgi:hypothetical protein
MGHQPPKAEVGCSNHLGCANHIIGLSASPALLENPLPALSPRNMFAGRSRERRPVNERAGSAATGTGPKLEKKHRPADDVDADDWSSYAAAPFEHELCAGCSRRGTAGRPLYDVNFGGDAFKMHWGCAIGLAKGRHGEVRS